jgi:hypothetical protein
MSEIFPLIPPANQLIPEDQVTAKRLCDILAASSIESTLEDDDHIYVLDGIAFPLWIQLHQDLKLILLFTYVEPTADETVEWLDKVNTLNASIIRPQFSYSRPHLGSILVGIRWRVEWSPPDQDGAAFC